jgi:hypothetical protein
VTVGLLTTGADGPGLAALVLDRTGDPDAQGPWPVHVQAFGPAGDTAADRVLAACTAWQAAGRPTVADLRLTVVPHGVPLPATRPGIAVVDKEHCRVLVDVQTA